jgi:manganese/zinc/iron transport system substrate-binding protein
MQRTLSSKKFRALLRALFRPLIKRFRKANIKAILGYACKISLTLLLFSTFFSCQKRTDSRKSWMEESGKIKVLTTIEQIGDLTGKIGGERIDLCILIQGELDPHSYEMVKGDDERLHRADLIFYNGLGLEHGASLSTWLQTSKKATALGDQILKQSPEKILRKGDAVDPHLWMDISLWAESIDPITDNLIKADPEGASYYKERALVLKEQMAAAHSEVREILHRVPPEKRYLVTSHDAFQYFTRSYLAQEGEENWRERFEAPEGLAPDGQLSPVDIRRIIDYLKSHGISMLFPESNVSRDSIRKIASAGCEMGLKVRVCEETLYGDAMGGENIDYLDMMRHNAQTIANYLGGSE